MELYTITHTSISKTEIDVRVHGRHHHHHHHHPFPLKTNSYMNAHMRLANSKTITKTKEAITKQQLNTTTTKYNQKHQNEWIV